MKNKPPYTIASVDHALHLAQLLQQEGPLRVTDAAHRLGLAPSTAHRLLQTLTHRDFAEQLPNAQYAPGPLLRPVPRSAAPLTLLRRVAAPHLQDLTRRVRESTNLVVVVGTEARFVRTVECGHALRVGDRVGQTVPADRSSGGKALLAQMPREQIDAHCSADHETELADLHRQLAQVRNRGFAINDQGTEQGVTAVGVAVPDRTDVPHAALSISMPSVRFRRDQLAAWATELTATAAVIGRDLEAYA